MKRIGLYFLFLFLMLCESAGQICAQKHIEVKDTTACSPSSTRKSRINNIFQQAWNSIQRNPNDTCTTDPEDQVLNYREEDFFIPFAGKIIRHIDISSLGFERNFTDTSNRIKTLASRAALTLHANTKEWVIRNNLFQKEGSKVDPYILSDNERYLRTLDYLQDARILVRSVPGSDDSVDLLVVIKDVFSIKIVLDNDGFNAVKVRLSENNFLGMGQRIQTTALFNPSRDPNFGYGLEYNKNNVGGSFIHMNVAYNNIDIGRSLGYEPEASSSFVLSRPLPSPYDYFAGGMEISTNKAVNVYHFADSIWYPYTYNIYDIWAGYNLSLRHIMKHDSSIRDRKFLAIRYYQQKFLDNPASFEQRFDPVYNNIRAVLAQFTFFKQDFIKTQYIYGFGITEDIPHGYNVSVTGGWWEQKGLQRPYAGITADYYVAKRAGSFCQYYLRTGSFLDGSKMDDATFMVGASYFSKLFFSGTDFKIRQYVRATYARIFNPLTYEPLRLDNPFGLRDFGTDSAQGFERISLQSETIFYTRYKIYGFRLAPFLYVDAAILRDQKTPLVKGDLYPGFGGGFRTRNENIIFGTIEVKAEFFPRPVVGQPLFKFLVASDLKYRYRTTYIHAPDIVRLNSDDW